MKRVFVRRGVVVQLEDGTWTTEIRRVVRWVPNWVPTWLAQLWPTD